MNLRFNVKDLQGLKIISPLDPSFEGLVASHFKGDAKPNRSKTPDASTA